MPDKRLLIGGVADGRWVFTNDYPEYQVLRPTPLPVFAGDVQFDEMVRIDRDHYRAETIHFHEGGTRTVYVLKGMSLLDAFDALVSRYVRPGN